MGGVRFPVLKTFFAYVAEGSFLMGEFVAQLIQVGVRL
jgi:hypothetical protein